MTKPGGGGVYGSNGGGLVPAPLSAGVGAGVGVKKFPRGREGGGGDCVGTSDGDCVGDGGPFADGVGDGGMVVPGDGDGDVAGVGEPWNTSEGDGAGGLPGLGFGGADGGVGGIGGTPVGDGPGARSRLRRNPRDKTS